MIHLTVAPDGYEIETPSSQARASYITAALSSICGLKLNVKFEHRTIDGKGTYYRYNVSAETYPIVFQIAIYDDHAFEKDNYLMVSGEYIYPDGDKTTIRQMVDLTNHEALMHNLSPFAKCCK